MSANPWNRTMDKAKILSYIPEPFRLQFKIIDNTTSLSTLSYPVIFKPVVCNGNGKGVEKINSVEEAQSYMRKTSEKKIIAQELFNGKFEAGVLYEKNPFSDYGTIKSIVLKEISGSGWKPQRCSSSKHTASNCYNIPITTDLIKTFNHISSKIPSFYVGRYDVRFDDMSDFLKGKKFKVLEVNGVMGFDLNTSISSLSSTWEAVEHLIPWISRRVFIGFQNIIMLKGGNPVDTFDVPFKLKRWCDCDDYEHLFQPSSA